MLRLAQTAHEETKSFAIDKSKEDARLRSIETVVRSAAEFVITMKKQPTRFELVWPHSSTGQSSSRAVFDSKTMEAVCRVPREGYSGPGTVRGTVFPGLQKWTEESEQLEEGSLLSKIQVLLY